MVLFPDFIDFITILLEKKVDFLLVGGYAVISHGYNRSTSDLDIWVNRTESNYSKLMQAFADFGLPSITKEDFLFNEKVDVFQFGRPPLAIDIMLKVKGLDFESCQKHVYLYKYSDTLNLPVVSLIDLISAKKASGRHKDLNDIEHLSK
jgi:hypothetical protein